MPKSPIEIRFSKYGIAIRLFSDLDLIGAPWGPSNFKEGDWLITSFSGNQRFVQNDVFQTEEKESFGSNLIID